MEDNMNESDQNQPKIYDFRAFNEAIRENLKDNSTIDVQGVCGQRYIGSAMKAGNKLILHGVPGNDLGCYMDGAEIEVLENAQDSIGNTMNEGKIVVHGNCGDTAGYAMRGGKIIIKGNTGSRTGIHMKEYFQKVPEIIIGGIAGDFLGEYMAGGLILVLGIGADQKSIAGRFVGTGMHGGAIYLRGEVESWQVGREVTIAEPNDDDKVIIERLVNEYCVNFNESPELILKEKFVKLYALNKRPYGNMYVGC